MEVIKMDKKKSFGEGIEAFFAGKGFYIVLFLCAAVIGVSAWAMLRDVGTDVDSSTGKLDMTLEEEAAPTGNTEYTVVQEPAVETVNEIESAQTLIPEEPLPAQSTVAETVSAGVETSADFFVWPVSGEIENGYSMAALVYNRTMQDWRTHDGLDIAAELGAQVKAVSAGTVTQVREDDLYGTTVVIDHGNGLSSTYSNLAAVPTVAEDDRVIAGQVIGSVGSTALCETGEVTHLHFSMALDGESADPGDYLP
jgi:murein DD-endopeptidase MepM/ murein hydrolase activator NlpD